MATRKPKSKAKPTAQRFTPHRYYKAIREARADAFSRGQTAEREANTERKRYNGWTNYETWLVNLWIDNEQGSQAYWREAARNTMRISVSDDAIAEDEESAHALADRLKDEFGEGGESALAGESNAFWRDLLASALGEVDWHEIAEHMIAGAKEDEE